MRLVQLALCIGLASFACAFGCGDASEPQSGADDTGDDDSPANPGVDAGRRPDDAGPVGRDAGVDRDAAAVDGETPEAGSDADVADADADAAPDGGAESDAAPDAAPPDPAALLVSAPSGTKTNELGAQITFTVHLARAPLAPVVVPLTSSDTSEASVTPASLVFTADDWDRAQTVTVTGASDELVDGTIDYDVSIGAATSDDVGYAGRTAPAIALANDDHPLPAYRAVDINHLLVSGQSNAVANSSHPSAAEMTGVHPTLKNLMFDVGVMTAKNCDGDGCREYEIPTDFVPIKEGDVFPLSATPRETLSSAMANQASFLGINVYFPGTGYTGHDVLVSVNGRSGNPYHCLRFGTCTWYAGRNYLGAFEEGLRQVRDAKALAAAKQKSYAVRGVAVVHGESDHHGYSTLYPRNGTDGAPNTVKNYADALLEWQRDYEREIRAITGQTSSIPLYVLQLQWTERGVNEVSIDQFDASLRAPGKVILAAPSYMLTFRPDCLHYTFQSQRRIGEYIAKAYAQTVFTGQPFEPLRPLEVTRAGNVLTVRYHVPVPPIVLDTAQVSNPGNFGFAFVDDGNTASIAAVEVTGADTVRITLNAAPTGANKRLRYAVSTSQVMCAGPSTGMRGNLRDSDATPSQRGDAPLSNWGVGFQLPVQ